MNIQNIPEQDKAGAIEWLRQDAAYLRKCAADYAARGGDWYTRLAEQVKSNAAHSDALADSLQA
jgi:hypothetical protein